MVLDEVQPPDVVGDADVASEAVFRTAPLELKLDLSHFSADEPPGSGPLHAGGGEVC